MHLKLLSEFSESGSTLQKIMKIEGHPPQCQHPPTKIRPDKNDLWTTIISFRLYFLNFHSSPPKKKPLLPRQPPAGPPVFFTSDGLSWSQDDPATALSDAWCSRRCVSLSDPTSGRWTSGKPSNPQKFPKERTHCNFSGNSQPLIWTKTNLELKRNQVFLAAKKLKGIKMSKVYDVGNPLEPCPEGIFTAHFLWNCSEFTLHCGWKNVQRVSLGCTHHPVRITTRVITFLRRNPELNLHLWLASSYWGGRSKVSPTKSQAANWDSDSFRWIDLFFSLHFGMDHP